MKDGSDNWQDDHDTKRDVLLDNVIRFIKKYKQYLLIAVIGVVGIFGSVLWYRQYQWNRVLDIVNDYREASSSVGGAEYSDSIGRLIEIINDPYAPEFYVYSSVADLMRIYMGHPHLFQNLISDNFITRNQSKSTLNEIKHAVELGLSRIQDDISREVLVTIGEFVNTYRERLYQVMKIRGFRLPEMSQRYFPGLAHELEMFAAILQEDHEKAKEIARRIIDSPTFDRYRKQRAESVLLYIDTL